MTPFKQATTSSRQQGTDIARHLVGLFVLLCTLLSTSVFAKDTYYTTSDNEDNAGTNVADADLDTLVAFADGIHPIEFDIDMTGALPATSATLAIKANDVDNSETDQVFINGNYVGDLRGVDGLDSVSLFDVPIGQVLAGDNLIEVQVDATVGLKLSVDWGQLLIDGGAESNTTLSSTTITDYATTPGTATIELDVAVNIITTGTYTTEINLIDQSNVIQFITSQTYGGAAATNVTRSFSIPYNMIEPDGTFTIEILQYYDDAGFNVLEDTASLTFDHQQNVGPKLPADPALSTLTAGAPTLIANGVASTTITLQGIDVGANVIDTGGQTVLFGTTSGSLSTVIDNVDGTYTATLTAPTNVGSAVVSATIDGFPVTSTTNVSFIPGPADSATSTITLGDATLFADGFSTTTITVQTIDANGNLLTSGGDTLTLATTSGNIGPVSDQGNGIYTATLMASTDIVTATVTGILNSFAMTNNAMINYIVGPASTITSSLSTDLTAMYADGVTQAEITLQATDIGNNDLSAGGDLVVFNTNLGTISNTTDNLDGTYTATLTSGTSAGIALITATIGGSQINDTTSVSFADIPTTNALVTNSATPILTGTATVIVGANFSVNVGGQTYVPGDGNLSLSGTDWTLVIPVGNSLADGLYEITASVTDPQAQVSTDTNSNELSVDTTPPSLVFSGQPDLNSSNTITYNVSGTCTEINDNITITVTDAATGSVSSPAFTCSASGSFNVNLDLRRLADGTLTITGQMSDAAGNQSTTSVNVEKAACTPDNSALACDSDGDTIPDGIEEILGMSPNQADSDQDGISDEFEYGTDLLNPLDTDGDGILDALDSDADNDGILDGDENDGSSPPRDSDDDGTPDFQDLDSDGDYVPDTIEHTFGDYDSDSDGILNIIDLDSDGDGIPDAIENGIATRIDTDQDGIDNAFDVNITLGTDANNDGIDDDVRPLDTDTDRFFDMFDIDSDNDGLSDAFEANLIGQTDADADGIVDLFDVDFTGLIDLDGDNIDDSVTLIDTDGDGAANHLDLDSDNDSIADVVESDGADTNPVDAIVDNPSTAQGQTPSAPDSDGDGQPNYLDLESLNPFNNQAGPFDIEVKPNLIRLDANDDGLVDSLIDTDSDGIADLADETLFFFGSIADHDNDGIINLNDLDDDNDGILDSLEGNGLIDTDMDGWADNADLDSDNDGVSDLIESQSGLTDSNNDGLIDNVTDANNDGVDDAASLTHVPADNDNDDIYDFQDLDSDNDTIFDLVEATAPGTDLSVIDANNDGRIDTVVNRGTAVELFIPVDSEQDTIIDMHDTDSDNDNILDEFENLDANGDGIVDRIQASGGELDTSIEGAGAINVISLLILGVMAVFLGRRINRRI